MKNNFNNINLHEIAQAINREKSKHPELEGSSYEDILKRILNEKHNEYNKIENKNLNVNVTNNTKQVLQQDVKQNIPNNDEIYEFLPKYTSDAPEDIKDKVKKLVEITFKKGLDKGMRLARKESPYVVDIYHDTLSDKLIYMLKEKKII